MQQTNPTFYTFLANFLMIIIASLMLILLAAFIFPAETASEESYLLEEED